MKGSAVKLHNEMYDSKLNLTKPSPYMKMLMLFPHYPIKLTKDGHLEQATSLLFRQKYKIHRKSLDTLTCVNPIQQCLSDRGRHIHFDSAISTRRPLDIQL